MLRTVLCVCDEHSMETIKYIYYYLCTTMHCYKYYYYYSDAMTMMMMPWWQMALVLVGRRVETAHSTAIKPVEPNEPTMQAKMDKIDDKYMI